MTKKDQCYFNQFSHILKKKPDFFLSYRVPRNKYNIYPDTLVASSHLFQNHYRHLHVHLVFSSHIRNQHKLHDNLVSETFHHLYNGNQPLMLYDSPILHLKICMYLFLLNIVVFQIDRIWFNIHVCSDFFRN